MNPRKYRELTFLAFVSAVILAVFLLFALGTREANAQTGLRYTHPELDLTVPAVYKSTPGRQISSLQRLDLPTWGHTPGRTETLLTAATALLAVDYLQTRDIATDSRFEERNPMLGSHPDLGDVNRYFAAATGLTWAAAYLLPEPWNDRVLIGVVGVQSLVVTHNFNAGVRWRF